MLQGPMGNWTCGYNDALASEHIATKAGTITYYGLINGIDYNNAAACGRCFQLLRTASTQPSRMVTFTVIGQCSPNDGCGTGAGSNQFVLGADAFTQIANSGELFAPTPLDPTDMVIAYDVPCPFAATESIYGQISFAGGAANGVRFTGNRYGITSVRNLATSSDLVRSANNLWQPGPGLPFGNGPWTFAITDVYGRTVTTSSIVGTNPQQSTNVQHATCP
jgi:hypothetical protein